MIEKEVCFLSDCGLRIADGNERDKIEHVDCGSWFPHTDALRNLIVEMKKQRSSCMQELVSGFIKFSINFPLRCSDLRDSRKKTHITALTFIDMIRHLISTRVREPSPLTLKVSGY